MASQYRWPPRYVEAELTDELLVLYLDAAVDRMGRETQSRFDSLVEGVRAGTIFGHDDKQYRRWHARRAPVGRGLRGEALEQAVMTLARSHPEYVVVGG